MATRKGQLSCNLDGDLVPRFNAAIKDMGFQKKAAVSALISAFVDRYEHVGAFHLPGLAITPRENQPASASGPGKKAKAC